MKKWILRDNYCRFLFLKTELKKNMLKGLLVSNNDFLFKFYLSKILWRFGRKSSISFYCNYCVLSGKTRSVFRRFKMVRHLCKKYASNGLLVGLRKSSF